MLTKAFTVLYVCLALAIISCTQNITEEEIIGNWELKTTNSSEVDYVSRYVFYPDHSFEKADDIYYEFGTRGTWKLIENIIHIDYFEGTGTSLKIDKLTDSELILIENPEMIINERYEFIRIPFPEPIKDTLELADKDPGNSLTWFKIYDADRTFRINKFPKDTSFFLMIEPIYWIKYPVEIEIIQGGTIKMTAVKHQYELFTDYSDTLKIKTHIEFGQDSVFIFQEGDAANYFNGESEIKIPIYLK